MCAAGDVEEVDLRLPWCDGRRAVVLVEPSTFEVFAIDRPSL